MRSVLCGVVVAVLAGCVGTSVVAHDLSHSQSDITVSGAEARAHVQLDLVSFGGLQWRGGAIVSYDELDDRIEAIVSLLKQHFQVTSSTPLNTATVVRYGLVDNHALDADLVYRFERPISDLVVTSTLDRVTAFDHQHVTRLVVDGGSVREAILTAGAPTVRVDVGAGFSPQWRRVSIALQAGAVRVITTPAHLALLVLLVLAASGTRVLGQMAGALAITSALAIVIAALAVAPFSGRALTRLALLLPAVAAMVNLAGGRRFDQVAVLSVFAFLQTLLRATTLRADGIAGQPLAAALAAFAAGAMVVQVGLVAAASPLVGRHGVPRPVRVIASVIVAALSVYWMMGSLQCGER